MAEAIGAAHRVPFLQSEAWYRVQDGYDINNGSISSIQNFFREEKLHYYKVYRVYVIR